MAPIRAENTLAGTLFLGIVTSGAYSFLSDQAPEWTIWISIGLTILIFVLILTKAIMRLRTSLRRGQYSVLVFVLDPRHRLLLIRHPHHQVYLPPGGRLAPCEPPNEGVARVLKEEAGLVNFEFDPRFHEQVEQLSDRVEQVPRPIAMHMEHREQRAWVPFHYAMVYVCRPLARLFVPPADPLYQPKWFTLEEIHALPHGEYPFDDIVVRYEQLLRSLGRRVKPSLLRRSA